MHTSDTNKIEKLFNEFNASNSSVVKDHKLYDIKRSVIQNKKSNEIVIAEKLLLPKSSAQADYQIIKNRIENFPQWLIPFTHVKMIIYSNDGIMFDTLLFGSIHKIYWKYIAENTYEVQIPFYAVLRDEFSVYVDLYCDISLIILNEKIFNAIQNNKS